jgi:hypothetical protein
MLRHRRSTRVWAWCNNAGRKGFWLHYIARGLDVALHAGMGGMMDLSFLIFGHHNHHREGLL